MAAIHSDEFKRDAVRIALTSGLTRVRLRLIWGFHNPRRKHSALGWKSSVAFEQRAA